MRPIHSGFVHHWRTSHPASLAARLMLLCFLALPWLAACTPASLTPTPSPEPTAAPARVLSGADLCRRGPRFTAAMGFSQQASIGTAIQGVKGLAIVDPAANDGRGALYQHPTWDDAGYLAAWTYDRNGNVYAAPAPLVSLVENPPELQNVIHKVDTDSQVMAEWVSLPAALPPSGANPYGVVGLAYDCDTELLYATSLAGSTAGQEVGRIFAIDLATGQVLDTLEGIDAMGVGVYNGAQSKRLFYGLARRPEVWSLALDEQGRFVGEPRFELSLAGLPTEGRQTVRRIRFDAGTGATFYLVNFNYTLQVAGERQETVLPFSYDPFSDTWSAAAP
jgi:hypothetical protein